MGLENDRHMCSASTYVLRPPRFSGQALVCVTFESYEADRQQLCLGNSTKKFAHKQMRSDSGRWQLVCSL
jgi:hypothetical protein